MLDRRILAQFLKTPQAIAEFERMLKQVDLTPTTIEEANALAATALAAAQQAFAMLADYAATLEQLSTAPVLAMQQEPDNFAPAVAVGTLGTQSADSVEITGGTVDATPIGATTKSSGAFTTVAASAGFGCNGKSPQTSVAMGAAASDLPTAIALVNNIRAALIANGIGS